jgi:hypothetical protein
VLIVDWLRRVTWHLDAISSPFASRLGRGRMPCCAAVNCSSRTENGVRLFRFPKNKDRRARWATNTKRDKWQPTDASYLCEVRVFPSFLRYGAACPCLHFDTDYIYGRLKRGWVNQTLNLALNPNTSPNRNWVRWRPTVLPVRP